MLSVCAIAIVGDGHRTVAVLWFRVASRFYMFARRASGGAGGGRDGVGGRAAHREHVIVIWSAVTFAVGGNMAWRGREWTLKERRRRFLPLCGVICRAHCSLCLLGEVA